MVLSLSVLLWGCHLIFPYPSVDRPGDASTDHARAADGAAPRCPALLGGWTLEAPVPLGALNTSAPEAEPFLLTDGLTLHFARRHDVANWELYRARRASPDADFPSPEILDALNTPESETRFAITADGHTAYLATTRSGGQGASDIWIATRSELSHVFSSPDFKPLDVLNSPYEEYDPCPSWDGLTLYYISDGHADGLGAQDILVSHRASASSTELDPPALVPVINTASDEDNPAISSDGKMIIFGSDRPARENKDLWYATRTSETGAFSTPQRLPVVNTPDYEGEAFLSESTCELFFVSDRQGPAGNWDIYVARITSR